MNKLALFAQLMKGLFVQGPRNLEFAQSYLAAWNDHSADRIVALTGQGAYQDPISKGAQSGVALHAHATALFTAFPDISFELSDAIGVGKGVVAARYRLQGRNSGPLLGDYGIEQLPPTGRSLDLPGVMFLEFDTQGRVLVRNSFDLQTFASQIGFLALLLPRQLPDHQFGVYYRINKGNIRPPEAIGITWIQVRKPEDFIPVATLTHEVAESFAGKPGFITGIVGAMSPDEQGRSGGFTLSAWENLEALDANLLPNSVHQDAVHRFMKEGLAFATHSRVYQLVRAKPMMIACEKCGKKNNAHKPARVCSACDAELPAAPDYW